MRNRLLMTISIIGVAAMMSGCSLLHTGPERDSEGRVNESTAISARDLVSGDCFTIGSAARDVVAQVTVLPCSEPHDYITIGQGVLAPSTVTSAGSLQNAVSAACERKFDAFKAAIKGDTRPKQEFMVFPEMDEPDSDQLYSCISTDPDQNFIPPEPTTEPTQEPTTEP